MDPLTAFSLACGVIQVVDFSTKVVVKFREIYKTGASSENKEIESMAKHLTDLFTDLGNSASAVPNLGPMPRLYHDDLDLQKLAQQCSETAKELVVETQKFSIQGQPRKRDVIPKAFKEVWKKKRIDDIQRRLELYCRTLDTRILIDLRPHANLISREQSDGFRDLDRKLQNLITRLSGDQNTFDELKNFIQSENTSSKQHLSQELERHRELVAAQDSYKRLLESLYFPDIHARQEGIKDAHKETFEWVFDKPGNEVRPWDNFINWLEDGRSTYWISGKAGAGKSTLMSFICQDPRTEVALKVWSGTNEVFIPQFFFWSPGTQLQKSLAGLLRSLIYQIVDRFPDLMPVIVSSMGLAQHRLQQLPTWTEHRLCATLQHLLSDGLEKHRLCIFIDGLDEFDGDYNILLDLVRSLRQDTRVKFCLSSRPYQSFRDEFGSSAMLKLQDLTEPDIRKYSSENLGQALPRASQVAYSSFKVKDTVDTIVRKAEGVFLWVNLAVKDQVRGILDGDDVEQLRERLELLPEEIEGLYGQMLSKIDKVHRKEVAQYLQFVLREDRSSLFNIALAVHKHIDDIVLFSPNIAISDIRDHCKRIGNRIATTCKGFLEVKEEIDFHLWQKLVSDPSSEGDHRSSFFLRDFWCNLSRDLSKPVEDQRTPLEQREDLIKTKFYQICRVDFLHRTAVDFFKDNEQGQIFLQYAPVNPHPQILDVKARLASLTVFPVLPVPTKDIDVRFHIEYLMLGASRAEAEIGVAQVALMDLLDRSLGMLCQRSPGQPSDLHWCRAWGYPELFKSLSYSSPLKSKTQHTSEPRNDGLLTPYPVDFLGFAAWNWLHYYVEHILDSQSGLQNPRTTDYLLGCVVGGLGDENYKRKTRVLGFMKLISALLKRGANPNQKTLESTVWGSFLRILYTICYGGPIGIWQTSEISEVLDTGCLGTVREFLRSGADVNEKLCLDLDTYLYKRVTHSMSPTLLRLESYRTSLHISALSVLQHCFAGTPILSEIEGAFIASGALSYFECTEISFKVGMGEDFRWVDSDLSKHQLKELSHALDQRLREFAGHAWKRYDVFERQIVELSQKLDINQLYEQAGQEDEPQDQSIQEEESQEDERSHETKHFLHESSTDALDSHALEVEGPSHSAPTPQVEP